MESTPPPVPDLLAAEAGEPHPEPDDAWADEALEAADKLSLAADQLKSLTLDQLKSLNIGQAEDLLRSMMAEADASPGPYPTPTRIATPGWDVTELGRFGLPKFRPITPVGEMHLREVPEGPRVGLTKPYPPPVEMYDVLTLLPDGDRRQCLDKGGVRLIDVMPRLCPKGRNMEYAIVRSARVSFDLGLKSIKEDEALVRYLMANSHTSPLEACEFVFLIKCPKAVAIHFLKHRTASINEFSQRYCALPDDDLYRPTSQEAGQPGAPINGGVRMQHKSSKQCSSAEPVTSEMQAAIADLESAVDGVVDQYRALLKDGLAKEVARFALPMSAYTTLHFKIDLNNLLKFFYLRMDESHAQPETVVYAKAMFDLVQPLIPTVIKTYLDTKVNSVTFSATEMAAVAGARRMDREADEAQLLSKLAKLGITRDVE